MQLFIKDRLLLPQILPDSNTFTDYSLKRAIINKVSLTDKDRELYNISANAELGCIEWDKEKDIDMPLDIDFTTNELLYLKKSCEAIPDKLASDDFWVLVEKIYNSMI